MWGGVIRQHSSFRGGGEQLGLQLAGRSPSTAPAPAPASGRCVRGVGQRRRQLAAQGVQLVVRSPRVCSPSRGGRRRVESPAPSPGAAPRPRHAGGPGGRADNAHDLGGVRRGRPSAPGAAPKISALGGPGGLGLGLLRPGRRARQNVRGRSRLNWLGIGQGRRRPRRRFACPERWRSVPDGLVQSARSASSATRLPCFARRTSRAFGRSLAAARLLRPGPLDRRLRTGHRRGGAAFLRSSGRRARAGLRHAARSAARVGRSRRGGEPGANGDSPRGQLGFVFSSFCRRSRISAPSTVAQPRNVDGRRRVGAPHVLMDRSDLARAVAARRPGQLLKCSMEDGRSVLQTGA